MTNNLNYVKSNFLKLMKCIMFMITFLTLSCSCDLPKISSSDLVNVIIHDNDVFRQEAAIEELVARRDWNSLVKVLPPNGPYEGVGMSVLEGLGEINNSSALSYLKEIKRPGVFVSGEYWATLSIIIKKLESKRDL